MKMFVYPYILIVIAMQMNDINNKYVRRNYAYVIHRWRKSNSKTVQSQLCRDSIYCLHTSGIRFVYNVSRRCQ